MVIPIKCDKDFDELVFKNEKRDKDFSDEFDGEEEEEEVDNEINFFGNYDLANCVKAIKHKYDELMLEIAKSKANAVRANSTSGSETNDSLSKFESKSTIDQNVLNELYRCKLIKNSLWKYPCDMLILFMDMHNLNSQLRQKMIQKTNELRENLKNL